MQRGPLQIRVSEDFEQELEDLARGKKKSVAAVCRDLMESAMENSSERIRRQLVRSLGQTQALLVRAESDELVEDVEELVEELAQWEAELVEDSDLEEESEEESE